MEPTATRTTAMVERRDAKRPRLDESCPQSCCDDIAHLYGVTFRLQYKQIAGLGNDDERFLIFRNDRRGAIAKAIFQGHVLDVLEVKPELRGHDLGGLLVKTVLNLSKNDSKMELEAEEEQSRYGKLVAFYEKLGFQVKSNAKIQYLHHGDQVYRKVPMVYMHEKQKDCLPQDLEIPSFVPIHWIEYGTKQETDNFDDYRRLHWLLVADTATMTIAFRSTTGTVLKFDENGAYQLQEEADDSAPHAFQLFRKDHSKGPVLFRSTTFGTYLSLCKHSFELKASPVYWHVLEPFGLSCIPNAKTMYEEQFRSIQTIEYVQSQRQRYGTFARHATLYEALQTARKVPGFPFEPHAMNLHNRCFAIAETLRMAGYPDWVQLIGLLYHLGGTVPVDEHEFQWQLPVHVIEAHETGVEFTWTGPEYMYAMVQHNRIDLPEDGIPVFRLASLSWRNGDLDSSIIGDDDVRELVDECAEVLFAADLQVPVGDIGYLWNSHYARIAAKYSADGVLEW